MNEWQSWIPLVAAVLLFVGTLVTVWATRGKTQSDFKTALDKRIDDKMIAYQEGLEERITVVEAENRELKVEVESQGQKIKGLTADGERTARRETLMFFYMSALRDHIINELPPPPPMMPPELSEWFEDLEATSPRGGA